MEDIKLEDLAFVIGGNSPNIDVRPGGGTQQGRGNGAGDAPGGNYSPPSRGGGGGSRPQRGQPMV
jgi:hypothetical protein